nr:metal-nicotianamine transporter YSL3-like [Tanacetum cinerariifolium]
MVMEHGSREINNMDMPEDQYNHTEHTDLPACDTEDGVGGMNRHQPWRKDITVRGIVASLMIGIMYSVIVMKLNLTTGLVPNLNVSAALLAFVFIRAWTKLLHKAGFTTTPFTKQENTIIQTCAVACYSIAVGVIDFGLEMKIKGPFVSRVLTKSNGFMDMNCCLVQF